MKPLLIYDGSCPACRVYTKGFVSMGLLSPEERQAHDACAFPQVLATLDTERARHEIPLVDLEGAEVRYGIDALLTVIGFRFPALARLVQGSFLYGWAKALYAFISYNRRVIVPAEPERWQLLDFAPRFHLRHRLVLIALLLGLVIWLQSLFPGGLASWVLWPFVAVLGAGAVAVYYASTTDRFPNWLDFVGHLTVSLFLGTVIQAVGWLVDLPFVVTLGWAFMIWQFAVRLRVMLLPLWPLLPFALLVLV